MSNAGRRVREDSVQRCIGGDLQQAYLMRKTARLRKGSNLLSRMHSGTEGPAGQRYQEWRVDRASLGLVQPEGSSRYLGGG
jgi:hypothetical protein